jgi:hypothetical protein
MFERLAGAATLVVLVSAQVVGAAAPTDQSARSDHNPSQFPDVIGDSGGAPDITQATVGYIYPTTMIRFHIGLANRPALQQTDRVVVLIDSDRNASTGTQAFDYMLAATSGGVALFRSSGSGFDALSSPTVRGSFIQGQAFEVAAAEIGGTPNFNFAVRALRTDGPADESDRAPEGNAVHAFALGTPHIDTVVARFSPAAPRAGKRFRISSVIVGLVSDERVRPNRYGCRATLAGKRLRGTGTGGCTFAVPPTARGKRLSIGITATVGVETGTSRPYIFRVR